MVSYITSHENTAQMLLTVPGHLILSEFSKSRVLSILSCDSEEYESQIS